MGISAPHICRTVSRSSVAASSSSASGSAGSTMVYGVVSPRASVSPIGVAAPTEASVPQISVIHIVTTLSVWRRQSGDAEVTGDFAIAAES